MITGTYDLTLAAALVMGFAIFGMHFTGMEAEKNASQFSKLLDESLNEMYVIDIPALRILSVNKGSSKNLGYGRDALKSMLPMDFIPGLTEEQLCDRLMGLAESKESIVVYTSTVNLQLSNI